MAYIDPYLQAIMQAVYGEDVRGSIHDAIEIINEVSEVVLSTGTAVTSASSSSTGFYTDSLYLNTDTFELWKCVGTDSWTSLGVLKGAAGDPGNLWYAGTGISGKSVNPTVYVNSGVANANIGDCYLNKAEGGVYTCTLGGNASTALWVFLFTMSGGGGANYTAGSGIDSAALTNDEIALDFGTVDAATTTKAPTGAAVQSAIGSAVKNGVLTIQQNGTSKGTFSANQSTNGSANIVTDEWFATSGTVSSGQISFSGIDDSAGTNAYEVYFDITSASTNKNPTATIATLSGEGTNNMSVIYDTDADNGATGYLRIIK